MPALLRATAQACGDAVAIDFQDRTTSFAEFDGLSDRVAAGLAARGIKPRDRVGLYSINSDWFALAYLGIVKAGAIVVPLNILLKPAELQFILEDAGATALIYHEVFNASVAAFRNQLDQLTRYIHIGTQPSALEDVAWDALLQSTGPAPQPDVDANNDLVCLLYTSGTTGRPKGAMLTHANLVSNTTAVKEAVRLQPGSDIILTVLPMFHAFAANVGMLTPLLHGCRFVPLPKFDPHLLAERIAATGATIFLGVPSMYSVLMNLPDSDVKKFASLRYGISGGAAMPQQLMVDFEHRFGIPVYEGDGPTECSPVTCVNPIGGTRKPASVGPPLPGVEMAIYDSGGQPLPVGATGEICVRGPNVMQGYWNQPEATAASFYGDWFRTGDLGYRDEDHYFYIVDRIKDLVIVNGMNVYPRMVEEVLYQFAPVREAAVIGEPHELHGEIPIAYLVLKEGQTADAAAVRAFCRERLGNHEVPRRFIFVDALPKNAAGKILKRELRKQGELQRGVDNR